jgi:transcriptional regulator with XRE-family HTH domain
MPSKPSPYQTVLRQNMRRVRTEKGLRQEDVAAHARRFGLRWDAATVTGIELGRRQVSAGELLLLPTLFDAPLTEFLTADGGADFDGAAITKEGLQWLARGRPLDAPTRMLAAFAKVEAGSTDAERKAARQLGIGVLDMIAMTQRLWEGRRLDQERDRRLAVAPGHGDISRRRGHVTSRLVHELREELTPQNAWNTFKAKKATRPNTQIKAARPSTRRVRETRKQ